MWGEDMSAGEQAIISALEVIIAIVFCYFMTRVAKNRHPKIKTTSPASEVPNKKVSFVGIFKKITWGLVGLVLFLCITYTLVDPEGAYCIRGTIYSALGQYDLAIADCNKAIELDSRLAIAYNNRAKAYYYKGQNDLAIRDYNKAIELDPELTVAYYMKGIVLTSLERKPEAIECFNKFLQYAAPGNPLIENAHQRIKALGGTI
jgi:tetratricopeptide (TPR) repeat protein